VSVTKPSDAVNAGKAKQIEGRPQLALFWLVGLADQGVARLEPRRHFSGTTVAYE
jgi:hypothetical protein